MLVRIQRYSGVNDSIAFCNWTTAHAVAFDEVQRRDIDRRVGNSLKIIGDGPVSLMIG
jgi:hypothetical protein